MKETVLKPTSQWSKWAIRGKKGFEKKETEKKLFVKARTNNIGTHARRETKITAIFTKHNTACQCVYSNFSVLWGLYASVWSGSVTI